MKLLLVEDDASIREGVSELLSELCEVRAEGTVPSALTALREEAFALVITDLRIGGDAEGGRKVAQAARESLAPVVIMSAMAREEVLARLRGLLPDGILPKPFQLEEVLEAAERFLSQRREAERCAALREATDLSTFAPDPSGLEITSAQAPADRAIWWFRAPAGTKVQRVASAAELSVIVEGALELEGGARSAGQALYAAPEAKVAWTATSDVLGVTVVFRR